MAIFIVFGNFVIAAEVMKYYESKNETYDKSQIYDVAIVLGGSITDDSRKPFDRIHFDSGTDRLLQAVQLYKKGNAHKILITAGSLSPKYKYKSEASLSKKFLVEIGIKNDDILIDTLSKNTYENAIFSKQILIDNKLNNSKLLLITSAFHMSRAKATFIKAGMQVSTLPCDFQPTYYHLNTLDILIPSESSFELWYLLFKEWIGMVTYKWMGYI